MTILAGSSNGRILVSGTSHLGSSPSPAADIEVVYTKTLVLLFLLQSRLRAAVNRGLLIL